jgi:PAS domain S-box-containing protein
MSLTAADTRRFVDVNERMAELTGYTQAELLGRTSVELGLVDSEEQARIQQLLETHGGAEGVRLEFRRRGEEPRIALGSVQRISIEGRDLWFTSMLDATAQARVEEERTRLAERARALERLGEIGNLAGGVAHDFNNLLLPILINVELAIPEAMGEARARLEEIQDAALRGRELTKKLLAVGRRQDLHVRPVDLNGLVRAAEPILRRIVPESIALEIALRPEDVCASADTTLLEQILVNLVVNARDAVSRDGTIRIATLAGTEGGGEGTAAAIELGADTPASDLVWLEVSDDGAGIPPETRARIFEPFFTTKEGSGTGLGLATVLGIVRQHGGRVRVDTEIGAGTRFQIGLPRADASSSAEGPRPEARAGLEPAVGRDRTILVVEDDPAVRRVTVRALGAFGFTVVQASDAKEALAKLGSRPHGIDLVVSDMVMPGMTGLELREALRSVAPHLPVIFVSGYSAQVLADHGVDRDSVRIVEKPFSPESLVRAVLDTLREAPSHGDAT